MTDWTTAANDYLATLARQPAARAPASIGEIWSAEWNRSGLDTLTGVGRPLGDAYDDLVRGVEGAAGRPIADVVPGLADAASTDERARLIRGAAAILPEDKRAALEPLFDVRRRASEKALKAETDANEVYAATYGLSGIATSWAAGIARQAVDPVNLATLPLGGPLKGPLFKVLLREAGIGALTQAVQEPAIEAGRAELGLEAGFGRGATNVAQAALGAAGLTGLFRAGAWAIGATGRAAAPAEALARDAEIPGAAPPRAPADAAAPVLLPDDLAAAAHVAERDQMIDRAAPLRTPEAVAAHAQYVHDAGMALERGADIQGGPLPPAEPLRIEPPPRIEDMPLPEAMRAQAPEPKASPEEGVSVTLTPSDAAPKPLGDPVIAREFERVVAEAGDIEIHLGDRRVKASEAMRLAESDAAAARELTDCIGAAA